MLALQVDSSQKFGWEISLVVWKKEIFHCFKTGRELFLKNEKKKAAFYFTRIMNIYNVIKDLFPGKFSYDYFIGELKTQYMRAKAEEKVYLSKYLKEYYSFETSRNVSKDGVKELLLFENDYITSIKSLFSNNVVVQQTSINDSFEKQEKSSAYLSFHMCKGIRRITKSSSFICSGNYMQFFDFRFVFGSSDGSKKFLKKELTSLSEQFVFTQKNIDEQMNRDTFTFNRKENKSKWGKQKITKEDEIAFEFMKQKNLIPNMNNILLKINLDEIFVFSRNTCSDENILRTNKKLMEMINEKIDYSKMGERVEKVPEGKSRKIKTLTINAVWRYRNIVGKNYCCVNTIGTPKMIEEKVCFEIIESLLLKIKKKIKSYFKEFNENKESLKFLRNEMIKIKESDIGSFCNFCQKRGVKSSCAGCEGVYYCNRECQKSDWKEHKKNCRQKKKKKKKN